MVALKNLRHRGKITSWKDDQGFGFITPSNGGASVFVHVKSFAGRSRRPVGNESVSYRLSTNEKGQLRAEDVEFAFGPIRSQDSTGSVAGSAPIMVAASFISAVSALWWMGRLPLLVVAVYLALSSFALVVYAIDKSAAQNNRWRTSEGTLHLLGLAGGWPGALLAQRLFRHKSKKKSFQVEFWCTVIANCAALSWLLTPAGSVVLRSVGL